MEWARDMAWPSSHQVVSQMPASQGMEATQLNMVDILHMVSGSLRKGW